MKVSTKKKDVKQFEPIEVTIVIESKAELSNLLARANALACDINGKCSINRFTANDSDLQLFNELRSRWYDV